MNELVRSVSDPALSEDLALAVALLTRMDLVGSPQALASNIDVS